jgi:predicted RNA-binding protein with PIN domain
MPYLIDGNNLLGSWKRRADRGDPRGEVVRRVAAFCRRRGARALIVFDGQPLRDEWSQQDLGPVSIRTPPRGQDADTLIRQIVGQAGRPAEWIVVTSDKPLYSFARTAGASILRAHEWNALERRAPHGDAAGGPAANEKPEREDDIDGWLKRFGGGDVDP